MSFVSILWLLSKNKMKMRYETFHGIPCLVLSPLAFYYFVVCYVYIWYLCVLETRFRSVLMLVLYLHFLRNGIPFVSLSISAWVGLVHFQRHSRLPGTLERIFGILLSKG